MHPVANHSEAAGDVAAFDAWLSTVDNRSPEQRLFFAVLARCWVDAFNPGVSTFGTGDDVEAECATARRWLTTDLEPWASARELVCQATGLDAEVVKRAARKKLGEVKATEVAPAPKRELTAKDVERRERRRASQAKYYMRRKAAEAHNMTLEQYDEMLSRRKAYNREAQRLREANREKWLAVAEANAAE